MVICLIRYCFSGKAQTTRYVDVDESADADDDRSESESEVEDEDESKTSQPSPLTVIQDLESEREENQHFAAEFLRSGRQIEHFLNQKSESGKSENHQNLRDFIQNEIPEFVSILVDTKMVIFPALEDHDQDTMQKYEQFERQKVMEFERKHKETMKHIGSDNVSGIRDLYGSHVVAFQQKKEELDPDQDQDSDDDDDDKNEDDLGFPMQSSGGCCNDRVCAYDPMSGVASYLY